MSAPIIEHREHVEAVLADAVVEDRESGIYRANRRIFTDEAIFELEMKHIFERNWIYLAHESQIPNPGGYFTTYIGRQPVVITRDKEDRLHCLVNACAHRGAMLCRRKTGRRRWGREKERASPAASGSAAPGRRLSHSAVVICPVALSRPLSAVFPGSGSE